MLEPYRVLDLTDERGWLAGKMLGDLGADVIKVEPPGGDPGRQRGPFLGAREHPERALRWLAHNTSKRSVVLDLEYAPDHERFVRLVASADAVLESAAPGAMETLGLGYPSLHERFPDLVYCALTPFGQSGPYADYAAHDLVVVAMGGNAASTGDPDRPPLRCSLPTGYLHAAPEAAFGVVAALYARERGAPGQLVDVSMHECQLQSLLSFPGQYALNGNMARRSGARTGRTREIWRARDGWISFGLRGGPARIPNLIATVELMDECGMAPDWLREYDWQGYDHVSVSDEDIARFEEVFGAYFASRSMRELYEDALARRILLAPCNDAREIAEHPQLRERELFARVDYPELGAAIEHPDFFAKTDDGAIRIRSRAPRLDEHRHEILSELEPRTVRAAPGRAPEGGIFAGLRILELGSGAAGPVASRYFAEQGADVVRIESAKRPDFLRLYRPPDGPGGLDGAPMFVLLNPNKKSVALNMTLPEGAEMVKRLVDWADVVAENFSPGVMERWGLAPESLRARKPGLVVLSNCLFGQTGPQRGYPGFGGQGSAIAGFNELTGWPDREAIGPYATITDSLSPRYVALAIAAALLERKGRTLDVSQIEAGIYSLSELLVRYSAAGEVVTRCGNHESGVAPHGIYPCAGEDRWIAISVFDDAQWRALRGVMGDPEWACDPALDTSAGRLAAQGVLDERIAEWTVSFDPHELMEGLQAVGVEAGAVQDLDDLLHDPQLRARGHFRTLPHEHLGALEFEHAAVIFSDSPRSLDAAGPHLGAHTEEVLAGALGLRKDEIDKLRGEGVLH